MPDTRHHRTHTQTGHTPARLHPHRLSQGLVKAQALLAQLGHALLQIEIVLLHALGDELLEFNE